MKIQTFANPEQINVKQLLEKAGTDEVELPIKLKERFFDCRGTPYRITFVTDRDAGIVLVQRQADGLQRALGRDYSLRLQDKLQKEYTDYMNGKRDHQANQRQTLKDNALAAVEKKFPSSSIHLSKGTEREEILIYGKSDQRPTVKTAIETERTDLFPVYIDHYTARAAIGKDGIQDPTDFIKKINGIKTGNFEDAKEAVQKKGSPIVTDARFENWKTFLQKNSDKLSVLDHLKTIVETAEKASTQGVDEIASKKTGWLFRARETKDPKKMVESFVDKNLPRGIRGIMHEGGHLKRVVELFLNAARSEDPYGHLQAEIDKLKDGDALRLIVGEILRMAFLRQTSKLGLEFAAQEKIPVLFVWKDARGEDVTSGNAPHTDLWWHGGRGLSHKDYGEITYSEMRHVDRMKNKDFKWDAIKVGSDPSIHLST